MRKTTKALVGLSILATLLAFAGCSDDDVELRKIGARCTPESFRYNGTDCQHDNVISCDNKRVVETICNNGCEIVSNKAVCVGGNRPGGNDVVNNCGKVSSIGMCVGNTLKYCSDEENKLVSKDCPIACGPVTDDEGTYYDCVDKKGSGDVDVPCGNVTEDGECAGNLAKRCVDGKLRQSDCSEYGLVCEINPAGKADCLSASNPPVTDGCGDIGEMGVCEGKTLKYCENDQVKVLECNSYCGLTHDDKQNITFGCRNRPQEACGEIDAFGICDGNTLKYCYDKDKDLLEVVECEHFCGDTQDENGVVFKACVDEEPPELEPCGEVPDEGVCDGKTLKYCSTTDDKLHKKICPFACGPVTDEEGTYYDCVDVEACGEINDLGVCDGKMLKYCGADDTLVKVNCENFCGFTQDSNGIWGRDCIDVEPEPCGDIDAFGVCDGNVLKFCDVDTQELVFRTCGAFCGDAVDEHGYTYKDCVSEAPVEACGDVTADGICDGKDRKYCEGGELKVEHCDVECKSSDDGKAICASDEPVVEACGEVTENGVCDGKDRKYCEGGELKVEHCEVECKSSDDGKAICASDEPVVEACGDVTADGICDGKDRKYCEDGELKVEHCEVECKSSDDGKAICASDEPVVEACGEVTANGICDGKIRKFCADDKLSIEECADRCELVEDVATCVSDEPVVEACGDISEDGICEDKVRKYCENGKLKIEECSEKCDVVEDKAVCVVVE